MNFDILYPLFAMVLLTFLVLLKLYFIRAREIKRFRFGIEDLHVFNKKLTKPIITSGDNYRNLFEINILFFIAILLIQFENLSDELFIVLAWIYVGLRYVHSYIHMTYNKILHRFAAYILSCIILGSIWIKLFIEVISLR